MAVLRELFLLDPEVVFLNHGSFGATPRPVFEAFRHWQLAFERQPVHFVDVALPAQLKEARQVLGEYVKAAAEDLVYVPNATFGVNVVARSLSLGPGDEVLATDHEYGACERTWRFLGQKQGFTYLRQTIPLPAGSEEEMVEQFWRGVGPQTRLIFISHITSPTALRLPVEAICARARQAGIITLVDGAHALGQIDLDLQALDADFYTSNAHKWLCSPKGSAFLYTRRDRQHLIEPLVVGWGWGDDRTSTFGSDYLDYLQWLGTAYAAAYLTVPDAIRFLAEHDWPAVRQSCHLLLRQAIRRIGDLTGLAPIYLNLDGLEQQMAVASLPPIDDLQAFKKRLLQEYRIEIPCTTWQERQFIRISVQGYNTQEDIDCLVGALGQMLSETG